MQHAPVVVTGATGFLGSWVVRKLLDRGDRVVATSRRPVEGCRRSSGALSLVQCDLGRVDDVRELLRAHSAGTVLHLAGEATIHPGRSDPLSTFRANVENTWTVLEGCRREASVSSVVVVSSDKAYGESNQLPYTEDTPLLGRGPYEVSKACADLVAQSYGRSLDLPVAVLRPGNFYGGGDLNWSRLAPSVLRSTFAGEPVVLRSDGASVRDYLYVEDAADAVLTAADALHDEPLLRGQAFNVAARCRMSTADFVSGLVRAAGVDTGVVLGARSSAEISEQHLDPRKFEETFGWRAATAFETGLARTVEWYRRHLSNGLAADGEGGLVGAETRRGAGGLLP